MRRGWWVVALTAGALLAFSMVAGCTRPADPVPFSTVEVRVTGGVAGQFELLEVRPDGTALRLGRESAAGRVSTETVDRLRVLLDSEDFRRAAAEKPDRSNRCTDVITTTVAMGSLSVSRDDTCGEDAPPVVGQILELLADPWAGRFAEPLGSTGPALSPVRMESTSSDPRTASFVVATAGGVVVRTRPDRGRRVMTEAQRDVVRMSTTRIIEPGTKDCPSGAEPGYRVKIGTGPVLPDCAYPTRTREIRLLAQYFDAVLGS